MPLMNGVCIPPTCFTVTFDTTRAAIEVWDTKANVLDAARTGAAALLYAANLTAFVNALANPISQPCDGCKCFKPKALPPMR